MFLPFLAALNKDLVGIFLEVPGVKTGRIESVGLVISELSKEVPANLLEGEARAEMLDLFLDCCRWGGLFWG